MQMEPLSIPLDWDLKGRFVTRPNRFLALGEIKGEEGPQQAHVHDPGRLKEILCPGNDILLRRATSNARKTGWDVIAGNVGDEWVLINSSFHRYISQGLLLSDRLNPFGIATSLKPEVKVGRSRLDYLMIDRNDRELYIEVKGCSLTLNKIALFPDAPTERGRRHLKELIELKRIGKRAGILILVLGPRAESFSPNDDTDPEFSSIFWKAVDAGVEVHPIQFEIKGNEIRSVGPVPLCER